MMVKGISKQVIMVDSQDRTLFDQAIFILSDKAIERDGVTDEKLLREAKRLLQPGAVAERKPALLSKIICFLSGGLLVGLVWLITAFS